MQTLIAIGALAITMLFALSTQRAEIRTDQQKILAEAQILAGQVAQNTLAHIAIQEFDENTRDTDVERPGQLTATSSNEWGSNKLFAACDDVDDFHGMQTHRVTAAQGLTYDIDASVRYVEIVVNNGRREIQDAGGRTFYKEVTLTVRDVPQVRNGRTMHILPVALELQRIVPMS